MVLLPKKANLNQTLIRKAVAGHWFAGFLTPVVLVRFASVMRYGLIEVT